MDQLLGAPADLRFGHTGDLQREGDVAGNRALHQQVVALEDDADLPAVFGELPAPEGGEVPSVNGDRAGSGCFQQGDAPQEGGFAGAGKSDDSENISVPDLGGDAPEGFHFTGFCMIGLSQVLNGYHSSCHL